MATVTMPQLGESVTEGTIIAWLKQPGDPIKLDDPLCEIETEKVTAELPSEYEGTMGQILVPAGEVAPVGAPLCEVEVAGEAPAPAPAAPTGEATPAAAAHAEPASGGGWSGGPMAIPPDEPPASFPAPTGNGHEPARRPAASPAREPVATAPRPGKPDDRSRFYSPAVMRLAREHGIDLAALTGSGIGGRVTRKDVEAYVQHPPETAPATPSPTTAAAPATREAAPPAAAGPFETVTLSATRKTIAANLVRSNLEAPQAWTMVEADVTGLVALREREKAHFQQQEGVELTLLPYFTAAVCESLRAFPMLNARWEGEELRRYHALDIGIAVATDHGLVVPVVHGAGDLSVAGLAKRIADIAQRAHARRLRVEDVEGGTFTVNNTGSFGSIASKPIVNHPQVGIVTMERAVKRPVIRDDDSIAVRWMMNVCLSFDHRALDGLEAGQFLTGLKHRLEAIS
ncbi:MAG: 2-oxo acid dehydrogenase subunit E2 [Dehalococcoidia bacterium]|nr:2-oxo acid dehydrogenase subunit E2 [Dehalococcoidia bacterium]